MNRSSDTWDRMQAYRLKLQHERYERCKKTHRCYRCGQQMDVARIYCPECVRKLGEWKKADKAKWLALGICIQCHKVPAQSGRQKCRACAIQASERAKESQRKRREREMMEVAI